MTWPTSIHESPDVHLTIPPVVAPHYLWSILSADGDRFRANDYALARGNMTKAIALFGHGPGGAQRPKADGSGSRWRTWKTAFEKMGLLSIENDQVIATRFGRAVIDGWSRVDEALHGANNRIALLGSEVANRVLLAPPGQVPAGVPEDANLHPLRAIWKAFRALDNRLHWQDLNRVLGHVHYEQDVAAAIEIIRAFREKHGSSYASPVLGDLGENVLTSDQRHITPWFNRASIGGLLFPSEADEDDFRVMPTETQELVDQLIGQLPPPLPKNANSADYMRYLMEPVEMAVAPIPDADKDDVAQVLDATSAFGQSKIVVLSGIPGTGKSRLAKLVADRVVDGDPSRMVEIQFHESVSYEDFAEGFVPKSDGSGFDLRKKALRLINQRAIDNPTQTHVLLIEEFTRANAHAVLGELLTYIEHRDRTFHWSISQEPGTIAKNLIVIATMNPRDKSALQLDAALRRRLHVINVGPSVAGLKNVLSDMPEEDRAKVIAWYENYLATLPFGHGLFSGATSAEVTRAIWRGTVSSMLTDIEGNISPAYQAAFEDFPFG